MFPGSSYYFPGFSDLRRAYLSVEIKPLLNVRNAKAGCYQVTSHTFTAVKPLRFEISFLVCYQIRESNVLWPVKYQLWTWGSLRRAQKGTGTDLCCKIVWFPPKDTWGLAGIGAWFREKAVFTYFFLMVLEVKALLWRDTRFRLYHMAARGIHHSTVLTAELKIAHIFAMMEN